MELVYDLQADTSGDTLEVRLNGCGLVDGSSASGISFDMTVSGASKVLVCSVKGGQILR